MEHGLNGLDTDLKMILFEKIQDNPYDQKLKSVSNPFNPCAIIYHEKKRFFKKYRAFVAWNGGDEYRCFGG